MYWIQINKIKFITKKYLIEIRSNLEKEIYNLYNL